MPPHVEVESHSDELHRPSNSSIAADDAPSPLFRDHDDGTVPISPLCRLDRRQSDPDFSATEGTEMILRDGPGKKAASAASPVVSVITAIIGPESAYVRATGADSPTTAATASSDGSGKPTATAAAASMKQQALNPTSAPTKEKKKVESKTVLLRATRYVSKKGWKVVKSLPRKIMSAGGSAKPPTCNHRNVV